uniref:Uncharacterized protein n=1 Tax=Sus scrofa TaxID=9823 RepID=A0A481DT32_PIG
MDRLLRAMTALFAALSGVIEVYTTSGFLPLEAGVDERLSWAPSLDPRSRATSLRIQVWQEVLRAHLPGALAGAGGCLLLRSWGKAEMEARVGGPERRCETPPTPPHRHPRLPASCRSKLHRRSARPSVSARNLEAASGPGTLERSKSSGEGPPERVRDALSSWKVRVTACCSQAALKRGVMSSAALRPKRAFYGAQGLVTRCLGP